MPSQQNYVPGRTRQNNARNSRTRGRSRYDGGFGSSGRMGGGMFGGGGQPAQSHGGTFNFPVMGQGYQVDTYRKGNAGYTGPGSGVGRQDAGFFAGGSGFPGFEGAPQFGVVPGSRGRPVGGSGYGIAGTGGIGSIPNYGGGYGGTGIGSLGVVGGQAGGLYESIMSGTPYNDPSMYGGGTGWGWNAGPTGGGGPSPYSSPPPMGSNGSYGMGGMSSAMETGQMPGRNIFTGELPGGMLRQQKGPYGGTDGWGASRWNEGAQAAAAAQGPYSGLNGADYANVNGLSQQQRYQLGLPSQYGPGTQPGANQNNTSAEALAREAEIASQNTSDAGPLQEASSDPSSISGLIERFFGPQAGGGSDMQAPATSEGGAERQTVQIRQQGRPNAIGQPQRGQQDAQGQQMPQPAYAPGTSREYMNQNPDYFPADAGQGIYGGRQGNMNVGPNNPPPPGMGGGPGGYSIYGPNSPYGMGPSGGQPMLGGDILRRPGLGQGGGNPWGGGGQQPTAQPKGGNPGTSIQSDDWILPFTTENYPQAYPQGDPQRGQQDAQGQKVPQTQRGGISASNHRPDGSFTISGGSLGHPASDGGLTVSADGTVTGGWGIPVDPSTLSPEIQQLINGGGQQPNQGMQNQGFGGGAPAGGIKPASMGMGAPLPEGQSPPPGYGSGPGNPGGLNQYMDWFNSQQPGMGGGQPQNTSGLPTAIPYNGPMMDANPHFGRDLFRRAAELGFPGYQEAVSQGLPTTRPMQSGPTAMPQASPSTGIPQSGGQDAQGQQMDGRYHPQGTDAGQGIYNGRPGDMQFGPNNPPPPGMGPNSSSIQTGGGVMARPGLTDQQGGVWDGNNWHYPPGHEMLSGPTAMPQASPSTGIPQSGGQDAQGQQMDGRYHPQGADTDVMALLRALREKNSGMWW